MAGGRSGGRIGLAVGAVEQGSQSSYQLGVSAVRALEALEFLDDADGFFPFHAGGLGGAEHCDGAAESLQFMGVDGRVHGQQGSERMFD